MSSKIIIPAKGLSEKRIAYYKTFGYRYANIVPLGKQRQEPFLVKKQGNESAVHTYVVETLRHYFLQHNLKPKRWITYGADLSLRQKNSATILAIEIETGSAYRINKEQLIRKFEHMQKVYDVVIILTDSYYKRHYQNLFPSIPILLRKDVYTYLAPRLPLFGYPLPRHIYYRRKYPRVPKKFSSRLRNT